MHDTHLNDIELFEYASGELEETQKLRADEHVAQCSECRSLLALAQSGATVLQTAPQFELPPERLRATLDALGPQDVRETAPAGLNWRRWLGILAPVAAVAGVIAIVVVATNGNGGDGSSESAAPALASEPAAEATEQDFGRSVQSNSADATEAPALDDAGTASDGSQGDASPTAEPELELDTFAEEGEPTAAEPAEETRPPAEPAPADHASDGFVAEVEGPSEDIVALLATFEIEATVAADGSVEVVAADVEAAIAALADRAVGAVRVRVAEGP